MIDLRKAQSLIFRHTPVMPTEKKHIFLSLGLNLARNIKSDIDMPPFDKSAMDGYAIRFIDIKHNLKIIEKIPAGSIPQKKVNKGECSYITTGAKVPEGADTVIKVEDTELINKDYIKIYGKHKKGENICYQAEDIKKNQVVLRKNKLLKPQDIGVLASVGVEFVPVYKKPEITLITTGDELVGINKKPQQTQIRDSNIYSLAAQVMNMGIMPHVFGSIPDKRSQLKRVFRAALKSTSDLILISGGVSKGEYDFNKEVLEDLGVKFIFEKIAIRPGMPTSFGVYRNKLVFGLAGNPVSTFVVFEILVRPAIKKMMGSHNYLPRYKQAYLLDNLHKKKDRLHFLPGNLEYKNKRLEVSTLRFHGAADLFSLTFANALIVVPKEKGELKAGSWVEVLEIGEIR